MPQPEIPADTRSRQFMKANQKCHHFSKLFWWKNLKMTVHDFLGTDFKYVMYQHNLKGMHHHHIYKQKHTNH
jgi:hypothetical protein